MKQLLITSLLLFIIAACTNHPPKSQKTAVTYQQYITILGTAQDAGYPHIGCKQKCCNDFYEGLQKKKRVTSLGLIDRKNKQKWLFEASPDIATQLADINRLHLQTTAIIDGVFLTHAHIGHYTGLMYFGREALGKQGTKVYVMPKMNTFLTNNAPWSQLVSLKNIVLTDLKDAHTVVLNNDLKVTPFIVPHRDEFSETVGYKISGNSKVALFIPDIDKWQQWKKNIIEEVKKVDYAFLDATFLHQKEVKRAMTEVPHPFIEETINIFKKESIATKSKIIFIHFNHTNPTLHKNTKEKNEIKRLGFGFAEEGQNYEL
ncbi:MBL fold metallo-hydrolase [Tenacibaculum maritimum]|uniref:MBL fold metallo-hydrolase n=2 Tax=Tenacibaculum maritimum TaxID=107401 RepID=UPI0003F59D26|nr:MBL fold metallo-hydrolase [Tenacibaculum maritimum]MCD9563618.1 MBL fold metallo-hydrolase [Tenacibaculum maritimum]MCD9580057.1 MBL fold metallo-hydrolase [Tenacibaculum maritimum]MCD9585913.1 MBL fold metallo-hydrolase [Tenacibaculum maritimum]MCD9597623.1 MBL fold metallo-hydrolase [Tenacibaculum maritimum]MCD9611636.1 MBL fold metallo-hydrolase [Tenacibaculum maritimum]